MLGNTESILGFSPQQTFSGSIYAHPLDAARAMTEEEMRAREIDMWGRVMQADQRRHYAGIQNVRPPEPSREELRRRLAELTAELAAKGR